MNRGTATLPDECPDVPGFILTENPGCKGILFSVFKKISCRSALIRHIRPQKKVFFLVLYCQMCYKMIIVSIESWVFDIGCVA